MLTTAILGFLVVCLFVAAVSIKKRPTQQQTSSPSQQPPWQSMLSPPGESVKQVSLRQQQLNEEASAISEEFMRSRDEQWRASLRADAASFFTKP